MQINSKQFDDIKILNSIERNFANTFILFFLSFLRLLEFDEMINITSGIISQHARPFAADAIFLPVLFAEKCTYCSIEITCCVQDII